MNIRRTVGHAAFAVLPTVLSVLVLVTVHRLTLDLLGITIPAGLLLCTVYQVMTCAFLWAVTGSRLPLAVSGALWGILATPFLGNGAGGGVLLPGVIGDQAQYSGWIVQGLGMGIPFLAAGLLSLPAVRRLEQARTGAREARARAEEGQRS